MNKRNRGWKALDYMRKDAYPDEKFYNNSDVNRLVLLERMIQRNLTELAMNRFVWKGFPESVDTRFLELTLFYQGLAVAYFDERFEKFLVLQGTGSGAPNMYNNPTAYTVVGNQFVSRRLEASRVVPIWANMLRTPELDIVMLYASKLADIDRTIEINSHNSRISKILVASENERLSVMNISRKIDEGQDVIPLTNDSIGGSVQSIDLEIDPDNIEKLHELRTRLWNEALEMLGIDSANTDKKERLVSAEVDSNDGTITGFRAVALNSRRKAAREIGKMFGLHITVDYTEPEDYGMGTDTPEDYRELPEDSEDN